MVDVKEEILDFLAERPNVVGAYGYGSGVFKQTGYTKDEKPQIDLILIVKDMKNWHQANILANPKDYSLSGNIFLTKLPDDLAKSVTGISYQSNIKYKDRIFKYGIIEEKDFLTFMNTWKSFYVPGRFQKPIFPIIENEKFHESIKVNRENAIKVGLLTLKNEKTNIKDLYYNITSLSYMGDIRMMFAENPNKIKNIVNGSFEEFNDMYGSNNKYFEINNDGTIKYDIEKLISNIPTLPSALYNSLSMFLNSNSCTKEDLVEIRESIIKYIKRVNEKESIIQPAKSILTNEVSKSLVYVIPKLKKKFKK